MFSLFCAADCRLRDVCHSWERSRGPIGAQWAWLRHRIAEINRQLSLLETATQSRPKQEQFAFATTVPTPVRPLTHPTPLWGSGVERTKVVNGTNHASSIPHLLIPDGILNGPIQVRVSFRYQNLTRNVLGYSQQLL